MKNAHTPETCDTLQNYLDMTNSMVVCVPKSTSDVIPRVYNFYRYDITDEIVNQNLEPGYKIRYGFVYNNSGDYEVRIRVPDTQNALQPGFLC